LVVSIVIYHQVMEIFCSFRHCRRCGLGGAEGAPPKPN
jgi:hypothetical protein